MPEHGPGERARGPWGAASVGFVAFLVVGAAAAVLLDGRAFSRPVEQPVAFNHRKHVTENQLDCSACHAFYETEAFSGLPDADTCATCHSEAQGKSEEERRLVAILGEGRPLAWKPLFRQPGHVFYSHRRHVVEAGLECRVCHGAIGENERPPKRGTPLRMAQCLACHEKQGASTACTSCHR